MRFPPEFLDRLRSQLRLSDIIGRRVVLRRAGREYQGLCPFHREKTPSFTVNDEKGFYHCFGCGAHGDAIRFLTENEGLPYPEAVERLAAEAGMALPRLTREQVEVARRVGGLQEVMELACQWYEQQLRSHRVAKGYLMERGLTGRTARHFRLGFAPEGRDLLKQHLLQQGVNEAQMLEAGLIIRPEGRGDSYDRFRARIMFPITDRRGKVIAFGGRVLPALATPGGREMAKYLNSPETPLFHKGEVLYAYEQARHAAHKANQVLVAEGYMDVIALYEAGYANAVAPLGTAITDSHLRLLWQLADEPVMCLDGDAAGQRAMMRAAEISLPLLKPGKSLRFLVMPKGEDPDTLLRKQGNDAFKTLLDTSLTLSDALWQHHAGHLHDDSSPEQRASAQHTLMALCEKITDKTVSSHYRSYFRKLLWPERVAKSAGGRKSASASAKSRSLDLERFMKQSEQAIQRRREGDMLRLILSYPALLQWGEVEEAIGTFTFRLESHNRVRQLILDTLAETPSPDSALLLQKARQHQLDTEVQQLYADSIKPDINEENGQHALQLWKLLSTEHALTRMLAECRVLEAELADNITEEGYARLVALKKQIGDMHRTTTALQSELEPR